MDGTTAFQAGLGETTDLGVQDICVGNGTDEAKPGNTVSICFECRIAGSDEICMSQTDKPLSFILGESVLRGWNVGIEGMKVGGKRLLICPPDFAYGANGIPAVVPPNAKLIFIIDLIELKQ